MHHIIALGSLFSTSRPRKNVRPIESNTLGLEMHIVNRKVHTNSSLHKITHGGILPILPWYCVHSLQNTRLILQKIRRWPASTSTQLVTNLPVTRGLHSDSSRASSSHSCPVGLQRGLYAVFRFHSAAPAPQYGPSALSDAFRMNQQD